jgi:hypothetical protein
VLAVPHEARAEGTLAFLGTASPTVRG